MNKLQEYYNLNLRQYVIVNELSYLDVNDPKYTELNEEYATIVKRVIHLIGDYSPCWKIDKRLYAKYVDDFNNRLRLGPPRNDVSYSDVQWWMKIYS